MDRPKDLAHWLLVQEARALLARIDRVKPLALQETMVPAANLLPSAGLAIDAHLAVGRRRLRRQVIALIAWLHGPGRQASPVEQQRRFTVVRLGFNTALAQLDVFSDAVTQRSEAETGVWLSGLDVAARDALTLRRSWYVVPPVVCYLDRGLGGAIRRAHTRLPGGGDNPVAVIRIPRERMIGFGVASSLVHEAGHQGAALLGLVPSLMATIAARARASTPQERRAWRYWGQTVSETVADLWAVARVGVSSTLGLIGIVSLPRAFVFRVADGDPHLFPWIRVMASCAIGDELYPHRQWQQLAATWRSFYPLDGLDPRRRAWIEGLLATLPAFARLLADHRPTSLRGASLRDVLAEPGRSPAALLATFRRWRTHPPAIWQASPTLVLAAFGRARITGQLTPEAEDRLLGRLITHWAINSTYESSAARASLPSPAAWHVARPGVSVRVSA